MAARHLSFLIVCQLRAFRATANIFSLMRYKRLLFLCSLMSRFNFERFNIIKHQLFILKEYLNLYSVFLFILLYVIE